MIVLSGGKKVFPEEVETVLEKSPLFAEICVFGAKRAGGQKDGSEDVIIQVVPNEDLIKANPDDKALEAAVRAEVKQLSQKLASYKRPNTIVVSKELMPRTATRKIKRNEVKKIFEDVLRT
jgi:long-chain acyl-CoA synthetase